MGPMIAKALLTVLSKNPALLEQVIEALCQFLLSEIQAAIAKAKPA
jgi:hypothetical protein